MDKKVCFDPHGHAYARPDKWKYIEEISARGDSSGGHQGTLDLLMWCGKTGLGTVTLDEARRYYESPDTPYTRTPPEEKP